MLENQLLQLIPMSDSEQLQDRLKTLDFAQGDILAEPDTPIERLVFPRSGLLSVVVDLEDGAQIEASMIGPSGALGGAAIFGAKQHLSTVVAQLAGRAWSLNVQDALQIADRAPEFRAAMIAQERYLLAQAQQTVACNAKHSIPQRLCSWLLRAQDEAGRGEFPMTQEMLGRMLGVQRASVSLFASRLQEQGLLRYRRGRVQIRDADGLAGHACECRASVRSQRERLFGRGEVSKGNGPRPIPRACGDGPNPAPQI